MAVTTRIELAASGLTGQRSNRLSYATLAPATGIEPVTFRLTVGRYCQLSYAGMSCSALPSYLSVLARCQPAFVAGTGFEPAHLRIMSAAP
jgi:hypothetical protein